MNPVNKLPKNKTCAECKKYDFCKTNNLCNGTETWCAWIFPNQYQDKEIEN